jgi:hypothetical protein
MVQQSPSLVALPPYDAMSMLTNVAVEKLCTQPS